jgi:transposase-like protein
MTEPTSAQDLFKGRHFDQEIIVLCVRWYLAFKLSSRDLVQMMAERGILLAHTTILRWCSATCRILKSDAQSPSPDLLFGDRFLD